MSTRLPAVLTILALAGCLGADRPEVIAERFWLAAADGHAEEARGYIAPGADAEFNPDGGEGFDTIEIGEVTVEDDRALVGTHLTMTRAARTMDMEFETVLVLVDDVWKIDLDPTTENMMRSVFGQTMSEIADGLGEALAEGMQEAMGAMADGVASGMQAVGEAMSEAMTDAVAKSADSLKNRRKR